MKLRGNLVVLSHDGQRLSAVWGAVQKDHIRVRGWLTMERPTDVDADDAEAVGAWVGHALKEAGCSVRQCVIVVPRASVVLKRLSFPAMAAGADGDLPGMVHLQMARQLTMPLHGAAIDFVRLGIGSEGDDQPTTTEVLAAALPGEHVGWCRTLAKSAKLRLRLVALRGEGSAALFAQLSYTQDGPVLGVSVTSHGVELGVVAEGRVVFSRAIDIAPPASVEDWPAFAGRVVVESKRTRMGYRGVGEIRDLVCVAVLGDDSLADAVGKALGERLDLPWETVRFPNAVEMPSDMDATTRAGLAPLIGLMLGTAINRPTYDFANPRKAPDIRASLRQAGLAAALGLIVFGGGGWVIADQQLNALEAKVSGAESSYKSYALRYLQQLRAEARVDHINALREGNVEWVSHLEYLSQSMPPADQARLELVSGGVHAGVAFVEIGDDGEYVSAKSLQTGSWLKNRVIEFSISGSATREVSDALRADLVASDVYLASTRGADVFNKFDYKLTTAATSPQDVLSKEEEPAKEGGES